MSIASKLKKLQTDIANAYDSIETKGGTMPQNKNTENLAIAISSISGGGSSINIFIQDTQPSGYDGIWIADSTYSSYPIIEVQNLNSLVASSINIVKGRTYETILYNNNNNSLTYYFDKVVMTNSNNEIVYYAPAYYGSGNQWIDITLKYHILFENGVFSEITGFTLTTLGGSPYGTYSVGTNMVANIQGKGSSGAEFKLVSNQAIDVSNLTSLKVNMAMSGKEIKIALVQNPGSITNWTDNVPNVLITKGSSYDGTVDLNINSYTGNYYIFFRLSSGIGSSSTSLTVRKIMTE